MIGPIDPKFLQKAVVAYGRVEGLTVAIEEMSELTKALCKAKRGKPNPDNIVEEIADVLVMMQRLAWIFAIPSQVLQDIANKKIERLENEMKQLDEDGDLT